MQVTSRKTIVFPKLKWGINKGEVRELPEDEKSAKFILDHPVISKVEDKSKSKDENEVKQTK